MPAVRARTLAAATVAVACLGAAQPAAAKVVYQCAQNLCSVADGGGPAAPVTTDGTPGNPYLAPTLSRDGTRLAYTRGPQGSGITIVDDDGAVRAVQNVIGPTTNRPRLSPTGSALVWDEVGPAGEGYLYRADVSRPGDDPAAMQDPQRTVGWAGGGNLLFAQDPFALCASESFDAGRCAAGELGAEPAHARRFVVGLRPEVAGRFLLATTQEGEAGGGAFSVVLYDAETHAFVRALATTPADPTPTFSPDGSLVAYAAPDGIRAISVNGGATKLLAAGGRAPAWSLGPGGQADATAPRAQLLKARRLGHTRAARGVPVRLKLSEAARVTLTVTLGGKRVGRLSRNVAVGTHTLTVKPSRAMAKRLRALRSGSLKVAVTAADAAGNRATARQTIRVS